MTVEPLRAHTAVIDLVKYRNEARESLRSGWTTEQGQGEWHETINNPTSSLWYWEFRNTVDAPKTNREAAENWLMGVGGLNFDRVNRSAELSVLAFGWGKGYGKQIVRWLIDEAFDNQNMHRVWAEVYDCNLNKAAWPKIMGEEDVHTSCRPDVKYWHGKYWDANTYSIIRR